MTQDLWNVCEIYQDKLTHNFGEMFFYTKKAAQCLLKFCLVSRAYRLPLCVKLKGSLWAPEGVHNFSRNCAI